MAAGRRSAVSERDETEPETRWPARKKADVVMRLLRGESLDEVSRDEVSRDERVEAHSLMA